MRSYTFPPPSHNHFQTLADNWAGHEESWDLLPEVLVNLPRNDREDSFERRFLQRSEPLANEMTEYLSEAFDVIEESDGGYAMYERVKLRCSEFEASERTDFIKFIAELMTPKIIRKVENSHDWCGTPKVSSIKASVITDVRRWRYEITIDFKVHPERDKEPLHEHVCICDIQEGRKALAAAMVPPIKIDLGPDRQLVTNPERPNEARWFNGALRVVDESFEEWGERVADDLQTFMRARFKINKDPEMVSSYPLETIITSDVVSIDMLTADRFQEIYDRLVVSIWENIQKGLDSQMDPVVTGISVTSELKPGDDCIRFLYSTDFISDNVIPFPRCGEESAEEWLGRTASAVEDHLFNKFDVDFGDDQAVMTASEDRTVGAGTLRARDFDTIEDRFVDSIWMGLQSSIETKCPNPIVTDVRVTESCNKLRGWLSLHYEVDFHEAPERKDD